MKKLIIASLLIPVGLFAQQKFQVIGSIQGLKEGSMVSLSDPNRPGDTIAKAVVKNNTFELTGTFAEANLYNLNLDDVQKKTALFIGNERVNVSGDAEDVQNIQVTGSDVHEDFEDYKKAFIPLFQELTLMGQRMQKMPSLQKNDSAMTAYKGQLNKVIAQVDQFIGAHRSSPVSPFVVIVTSQIDQDPSALERRYQMFDKKVQDGFYGKLIRQQLDEGRAGEIGSQAIEFSQADPDGKMVSLSSFKGKYVLVDFWASWCRPCRQENPNVVKAYNKYKNKNFTVLGVSLDNQRGAWIKAIKDDNLSWTQVSDLQFWNNEAATKYKIQSIPQNILVDPSGKIVAKNLRGHDLDQELARLLK